MNASSISAILFCVLIILQSTSIAFSQALPRDSSQFQLGTIAYDEERFADAKKIFSKLVESDDESAPAYYMLAQIFLALGDNGAEQMIGKALGYEPNNVRYMAAQHKIGFPSQKSRATRELLSRQLIQKIRAIAPTHALVTAQDGRDNAQIFLHNKNRISIPDLRAHKTAKCEEGVEEYCGKRENQIPGKYFLPPPVLPQSPDPFDIEGMKARGYMVQDRSHPALVAYRNAVEQLYLALFLDPTLRDVYTSLFAVYAVNGDIEEMLELSRAMRMHFPDDPHSFMYSGYASNMAGLLSDATYYFQRGLDAVTEAERSVYMDINRVLNNAQLDQIPDDAEAFRKEFWTNRDPRFMSPQNERELEHYARLVYSDLVFGEPKLGLRGWDSDRGKMYVRFGKPAAMFYMSNIVADCGERMSKLSMNSVSNFHVFEYGLFRLVFGNHGNHGGSGSTANDGNPRPSGSAASARIPRLNEFPLYSPCGEVMSFISSIALDVDYVQKSRAAVREIPNLFRFVTNFARKRIPYQASFLRGKGGMQDVYINFGVPISSETENSSESADIEGGAFLVSETQGRVAQNRLSAGVLSDNNVSYMAGIPHWTATHQLNVPAGRYTMSVEFESRSNNTAGYERAYVTVPDYSTDAFMLSDIVMALLVEEHDLSEPILPGSIVREDVLIQPAAWNEYERSQPIYFYFEIYNLLKGRGDRTEYKIEAILFKETEDEVNEGDIQSHIQKAFRNNDGNRVTVSIDSGGSETDESHYFILDTQNQAMGQYLLAVRVTDIVRNSTIESYRLLSLK